MAIDETGRSASDVLSASDDLARQSDRLATEVKEFLVQLHSEDARAA